jgi:hypothetical protein
VAVRGGVPASSPAERRGGQSSGCWRRSSARGLQRERRDRDGRSGSERGCPQGLWISAANSLPGPELGLGAPAGSIASPARVPRRAGAATGTSGRGCRTWEAGYTALCLPRDGRRLGSDEQQ